METFSALLAICAGNSPVPGEFPTQRPVTRSFDVFFDLHPNKRLSKQWWGWWFETLSCPLWRHRNGCPELSQLRDRERFWWKIWVENGRPRQGAVFDCYKGVKKLFRKLCRRKITNINDNELHNINECFKARKMSSFWNQIKNRRQKQWINSSLDAHQLAEYYRAPWGPATHLWPHVNAKLITLWGIHSMNGLDALSIPSLLTDRLIARYARCAKMCLPVLMVSQLSILSMETLKYWDPIYWLFITPCLTGRRSLQFS